MVEHGFHLALTRRYPFDVVALNMKKFLYSSSLALGGNRALDREKQSKYTIF